MQITYADKLGIFNYLADPKHWENIADVDAMIARQKARYNQGKYPDASAPADYFQAVSFTQDFVETLDIDPVHFNDVLKMVVAVDLDIELDISRYNEISPHRLHAFLKTREERRDKRFDHIPAPFRLDFEKEITDEEVWGLQKPWYDTTKFNGHVGLPTKFRLQAIDGGVRLRMTLEGREAVRSQTDMLNAARDRNDVLYTVTAHDREQLLFNLLENGVSVRDHLNREWSLVVLEGRFAEYLTKFARLFAQEKLHLSGTHFSAINFAPNLCFIAMEAGALKHARTVDLKAVSAVKPAAP